MDVSACSQYIHIFQKIFKNFRILTYRAHIWNQHGECIEMSTNMPMIGPVVLEIVCDIFIKDIFFPLKHIVSVMSINLGALCVI